MEFQSCTETVSMVATESPEGRGLERRSGGDAPIGSLLSVPCDPL